MREDTHWLGQSGHCTKPCSPKDAESQLPIQENDVEGLRAKLEAAQKVAEAARFREDEARASSRQHSERARASASKVEELEEDLATLRSDAGHNFTGPRYF